MSTVQLTPEQEEALRTLETTRDYAAGQTAFDVLKRVRRPWFDIVDALLGAGAGLFLTFVGKALEALAVAAPARLPITLAGLAILFAIFIHRRRRNRAADRVKSAMNRWRQIAGSLAVQAARQKPAPTGTIP
jgi:hypothetical protein